MKAPAIARVYGILFLLAGALALVPAVTPPAPLTAEWVTLNADYGMLLGLFPVNAVHDFLHVVFGGWGVLASFGHKASVIYLRAVMWIYLALVVLGLIPITNTLFGIAPIYGHDVWLHLLFALVASYGGYGAASMPPPPEEEPAF